MKVSVIIPCFNETSNIEILCERIEISLEKNSIPFEVILIDDGSQDDTWVKIERILLKKKNFVGIKNVENFGIFKSWKIGVTKATGDLVCLIDADLQNQPEDIARLYHKFNLENCHVIQGTRSSIERHKDSRYHSSRALNFLLNVFYKDFAKDSKSGFVLAPKTVLVDILTLKKKYFFPQTFIRISARSKGYSISEMETLFLPRKSGVSFLSQKNSFMIYLKVLLDIIFGFFEFKRGLRSPSGNFVQKYKYLVKPKINNYRGWRKMLFNFYFFSLPLHSWLISRETKTMYKILNRTQWFNSNEISDLQNERLRNLVWHAYSNVPYYQKKFKSVGLHPSQIRTAQDLSKIPLLNKSDVTDNLYMDLFSIGHTKKEMLKIATSGSTGQPFVTYADRTQLEMRFATTIRALEWTGWKFGDRQLRLWHQRLGMSWVQAFKERFDALILRRKFIPAFELTEKSLEKLVKELNKFKPKLIDGYAESLNFLSLYLNSGGQLTFKPKAVMSSAQMLTSKTRTDIEGALGTRVFDKYGAREFSGIAYQCAKSADHHVMDESYIIEILHDGKPVKPGETGEIVITDLNNYSVPLIRYRIGDLAIAVDNNLACPCGRSLSRIGDIQGRTQAIIYCNNGRWLPGTFFAHFFKDYDNIVLHFQVIQKDKSGFILKIKKGYQWNPKNWEELVSQLRQYVGDTPINIEFVESIPLLKTGKRTPVISYLEVDFQEIKFQ
jgi:phenylacetate-CoA ligase